MSRETTPTGDKWGVLMPLVAVDDGCWKGVVLNKDGEEMTFYYDSKQGLMKEEEEIQGR